MLDGKKIIELVGKTLKLRLFENNEVFLIFKFTGAVRIKIFFFVFFFFGVKLGHFTANSFLLYVTNKQAYQ